MPLNGTPSHIQRRVPAASSIVRITLAVVAVSLGLAGLTVRIAKGPLFAEERGQTRAAWTDDYLQDHVSARAWRDGADPYAPTVELRDRYVGDPINDGTPEEQANPHPPAALLLVVPLTFLPYAVARALWLVLSASAIVLAIASIVRALGVGLWWSVAAGVGALALPVVQKDLSFGQNNGMILLLLVGAWLSLRDGRQTRAGALLGVAVAIKLYPAVLLVPLVRTGARRAVTAALGAAVATAAVAVALVGWDSTVSFITEASPGNFEYWRAGPLNISLLALPFRWLTENPWRDAAVHLPVLAVLLALLAVAVCIAGAWRTRGGVTGDVFWAAIPWMILATPLAWEHYLVLALPPATLALVRAVRANLTLVPIGISIALIVIGTLPGVPTTVPGISDLTQVLAYGIPLYGLLALALLDLRDRGRITSGTPGQAAVARAR